MSMVINLVEDHNIYLCEGGPVYNGGVQPPPITYLTQWKIVGNSQVHTDPFLTSWKVSGNSVVDNNTILSCGDLGQDGKYHVKISNGVDIYDIALDEPLRKVNDVADTIEFPSETEGKALVTRNLYSAVMNTCEVSTVSSGKICAIKLTSLPARMRYVDTGTAPLLCNKMETLPYTTCISYEGIACCLYGTSVYIRNSNIEQTQQAYQDYFDNELGSVNFIYQLATPTTELVNVSPIAVSPTDTYTSANVTPYSAFEHTKHSEIWSCGEYNAIDGKYHILVQPLGGSIADIALTEPLRMVNDVADTIEFPSDTEGKALVTRNLKEITLGTLTWTERTDVQNGIFQAQLSDRLFAEVVGSLCVGYTKPVESVSAVHKVQLFNDNEYSFYYSVGGTSRSVYFVNRNYAGDKSGFEASVNSLAFIYELATPTTELVDAPQIEEADSYSMVISQGGKAVSWSSFDTDSE